jgi:hypothetical protein
MDRPISRPEPDKAPKSYEYVVHEHEFDIIPSICHYSKAGPHKSTICYVKEIFAVKALANLVRERIRFITKLTLILDNIGH